MSDWNEQIIKEFHDNDGVVAGQFAGANMVLLHHVGRKSGEHYVTPVVWFAATPGSIYVVASFAGAPKHPQWYENLMAVGRGSIEVGRADGVGGIDAHDVRVRELPEDERARVYADIVKLAPNFGDYETKTDGIRTIPVLELIRS